MKLSRESDRWSSIRSTSFSLHPARVSNSLVHHKMKQEKEFFRYFIFLLIRHIQANVYTCPQGEFACGELPQCVKQRFQCDGHQDCQNGADEVRCGDAHAANVFPYTRVAPNKTAATQLKRTCDIASYPPRCLCQAKTIIICKDVPFQSIPNNIDMAEHMTTFSLINNSLTTIKYEDISFYGNLNKLVVTRNLIYLSPGTFSNMTNLQKLLLPNNKLQTLDLGVFHGLDNVLEIDLQSNLLQDFHLNVFNDTPRLRRLILNGNFLELKQLNFPPLPNLNWLDLSNNQIKELFPSMFGQLPSLGSLILRHNQISYLSFANLSLLGDLDLAYNQLKKLHPDTFKGLVNLSRLILDHNQFKTLPRDIFLPLHVNLRSLSLDGIDINNISIALFSSLDLEFVYFKKFHYCTYAPHVRNCSPKTDGVSSIDNLLGRPILRLSVWLVGALTCLGNTIVLWGRMISREENKILSLFIRNLAAADFMMGVYLFIIGAHDLAYRDEYIRNSYNWLSSWRCTFCGALAMTSTEASVFILCYMSLERFVCIVCPFGNQNLSMRNAFYSLAAIWSVGIILAFIPVLQWQNQHKNSFYGTNGMCFPLHIDDPFLHGWEYSAFIFLGLNGIGVVVICTVYAAMFISIKRTRKNTPLAIMDTEFAFRFFCIVFTDCVCWIPIIVLKISAFYSAHISADFYAWVVVFILPINSALNPILYTFTTSKFRSRIKQFFWTHPKLKIMGHVQRKDSADTDSTSSSKRSHHKSGSLDVGRENAISYQYNCPAITDVVNGKRLYKSKFYLGSIETCI